MVAVSGGPDSTALLLLLHELQEELGLRLSVATVDHQLRPESAADAAWVMELAARLGLPGIVLTSPVPERGSRRDSSLEERARRLRYEALTRQAEVQGAGAIAVGHTADDQVETVLWRLISGAPLPQLVGMPRHRELDGGRLVRPLLLRRRAELDGYLAHRQVEPREDESNRSPRFLRNRLRHEILPKLRALAPRVDEAVLGFAAASEETLGALRSIARPVLDQARSAAPPGALLALAPLLDMPSPVLRLIFRRVLLDAGLGPIKGRVIDSLLALLPETRFRQERARVRLPGGRELLIREGALRLDAESPSVLQDSPSQADADDRSGPDNRGFP